MQCGLGSIYTRQGAAVDMRLWADGMLGRSTCVLLQQVGKRWWIINHPFGLRPMVEAGSISIVSLLSFPSHTHTRPLHIHTSIPSTPVTLTPRPRISPELCLDYKLTLFFSSLLYHYISYIQLSHLFITSLTTIYNDYCTPLAQRSFLHDFTTRQ